MNNIETLACVTHILDRGVEWFKSMGVPPDPANPRDAGSYGPKLYCVSGHVNKPGCYELPMGITVALIDEHAGGVWKGRKAKAVVPGGMSMGFLTEKELDTPLDFNGPGKVGCLGLGTAAVIVIDDQTNIVEVLYNSCRFYSHELRPMHSLPRGTAWMTKSWNASSTAAANSATSTCCWRSLTASASSPARRSAASATEPPGPSKTPSTNTAATSKIGSTAEERARS